MNENLENLIEQIRAANLERFGCHTEKMSELDGQLSFFNEAEYYLDDAGEPELEEFLPQKERSKKQKDKREADLKDFPEEMHEHDVAEKQLNEVFGEGNWREMLAEEYKRLRYEPASWTVENHKVHVYVGTDGSHQNEFLCGDRPKDFLRNSIHTPSLGAAIMNAKYVNSLPLYRIEQEFQRNGMNLSHQTMANWVIRCSERYLSPLYVYLRAKLLEYHVTQADETPVEVIHMMAGVPEAKAICGSTVPGRCTPTGQLSCMNTRRRETVSIPWNSIRTFKEYWLRMVLSSIIKWAGNLTES